LQRTTAERPPGFKPVSGGEEFFVYHPRAVAETVRRLQKVARKLPLPPGTFAVGAGIAIIGLASYVFQVLAYRQLTVRGDTAEYSAVFGLWTVVYIVTPGFFQPLEQEVGRAVAHRRAQGIGAGPLVKRSAVIGAALALFTIGISVAAVVPLTSRVFDHNSVLFISLLLAIVIYSATYIARGTYSGNGRFGAYGVMLASDGIVRVIATVILVVVGCRTPGPYALAIALPPAAALFISSRGQKNLLLPGPPAPYSELSTALGWLVLGAVFTQALSYSPYVAAIALETHADANRVGKFAAGFLVARIPILAFGAVQAALLPRLAGLAGAGRDDEFRSALRSLLMIVFAVGVVGALCAFTFGHFGGRVLFGSKFTMGNRDLGLLAVGSGGYMFATAAAQALLALRSYAAAAWSWLAGCVTFVIAVALGHDLLLRSEIGYVAGALGASVAMLVCLAVRLRSDAPMEVLEGTAMFEGTGT
jgi:O-antigen/teichoic acid export membrane protein